MFGSKILDVAIGLAVIYLMLSLIASAVREAAEAIVKSRAVELERGIRALLDDPQGTGLAKRLYEHPLVSSLYPGRYRWLEKRYLGWGLPTYIPTRTFAVALLDMATRGIDTGPYAAQQTAPVLTADRLRASVRRIPSPFVQRAMLTAIDTAQGDVARVQKNLEEWYDSAMDRVSGHYKRRTQAWLFVIGLGTTVALNVNTITIADYLAKSDQARDSVVSRAEVVARDPFYRRAVGDTVIDRVAAQAVYADLQSLRLPIGWERRLPMRDNATGREQAWYFIKLIVGMLLTAFAVMLGAPFWFDLLNKFMVIRSTVKPKEKSPEEGSEDRQKGKGTPGPAAVADAVAAGAAAGVAAGAATARSPADGRAVTAAGPGAPGAPDVEPPHEDHEWATGNAKEGIL